MIVNNIPILNSQSDFQQLALQISAKYLISSSHFQLFHYYLMKTGIS